MPPAQRAGYMPVDPAPVRDEVVVDEEASGDRAARGDPLLDGRSRQLLSSGERDVTVLPVRSETRAVLVNFDVRVALLEGQPVVPAIIERLLREPASPAVPAAPPTMAVEEMGLGQVHVQQRIAGRDPEGRLQGRDDAEGDA